MEKEKIRILYIANMNSDSGVACFLMNFLREFDMKKLYVDFICWDKREDNFFDEINKIGGRVFLVANYKKNPIRFISDIHTIVKNGNYDVIHGHEAIMSLPALRYGKKYLVPVRIAHSHSVGMVSALKEFIVKVGRRYFRKYCTDLMACSQMAGDYLFGKEFFEEQGVIVHNAITASRYQFDPVIRQCMREKIGVGNEKVIGHVGRFNANKNHKFLVEVFNKIVEKELNAKLLLIGDGETMPDIKKEAKKLGIIDQIIFLGVQKNVSEWMQAIDVFVFPSFNEGLGIVLIEAQASGLCCCCSDTIPEEAKCSKNMKFISLNDSPEKWAETILQMECGDRTCGVENIRNAGYYVQTEGSKLQEFYLKKVIVKRGRPNRFLSKML